MRFKLAEIFRINPKSLPFKTKIIFGQNHRKTARNQQRGFTLLEVMVALAIAAIGLGAVSKSLSQNMTVADRLGQKMIATWVASNYLAEAQISRYYLSGGSDSATETMAGRDWQIDAEFSPTGDNQIVRVDVSVYESSNRDRPAAKLFGFLSQPKN